MEIQDSGANSKFIRDMPKGCKQCIKGQKSVLFVSGMCERSCYYCPLSEQRKNTEKMWINEAVAYGIKDIFNEIDACRSKGVGITGGEPLLNTDSVIEYIKQLKDRYGLHFHIHMYTGKENIPDSVLKSLKDAGLDEIRFHHPGDFSAIKNAIKVGLNTGIEIPVIPKNEGSVIKMIKTAEDSGVSFINLNELEYSDTNSKELKKRGFKLKDDDLFAVSGSEESTEIILKWCLENTEKIDIHYCSASTKYDYQYWQRLKRRAKNICKIYESVTKSGLLRKGVISGENPESIIRKLAIKEGWFDIRKNRIETTVSNARLAARKGLDAAVVLEMPTSDPFDMELTPLDRRGKEVE